MTYISLPIDYAIAEDFSSLPLTFMDGGLGTTKDTDTIYIYDAPSATWIIPGGSISPSAVSDTDSIDLSVTLGVLTADLNLSADSPDMGFIIVDLSIESDGLKGQVDISDIRGLISVTDTDSIDMSYLAGVISSDLRISSNVASANNTIVALNIESTGVLGLRAQIANSGVRALVSATAPIQYNNGTGVISITSPLPLTNGGTNASLVAANGAIPYSGASALALLAPGTAGQPVLSGGAGAPTWFTGTGVVKAATGVLTASAVNLASEVTGILPLANGGTAAALSAVQGGVAYSTATVFAFSAAGSAGQFFKSAGTSTPVFSSAVSINYTRDNETTNTSFIQSGYTPTSVVNDATNLQSATATFTTDGIYFSIQIGTERRAILCYAGYADTNISAISDIGNLFLVSDAGTGVYVFKTTNSGVINFKNRMGGTRKITITGIDTTFSAVSAWT